MIFSLIAVFSSAASRVSISGLTPSNDSVALIGEAIKV